MKKQRAQLKILTTTDLHAHITNYDYYRDEVLADFGLLGLVEIIKTIRGESPNTLLLDNGDFLQGNPIGNYLRDYSLDNMHPIVQIMNALSYDAGTLGNHEFDFGINFLEKMLRDIQYPIVNANIVDANDQPWIKPYVILERNLITDLEKVQPIKVGIIGALPPQVMMWNHKVFSDYAEQSSKLYVNDIVDSIQKYIPQMRSEGADIIIVLAHSGFSTRPYEKGAENVISVLAEVEGIDAIVAGHAHDVFPDNIHEFNTPIVMSGCFGQYLGVFDFELEYCDQRWNIQNTNVSLMNNKECNQLDLELFTSIEDTHNLTKDRMNMPIGLNHTTFSSALSLLQDDECIQLIADAQKWYAEQLLQELPNNEYADLPLLTAVPAFKVGGRKNAPYDFTGIEQGVFTFKNVADLYPFNNQLALLLISGKELTEWLECANSIYFQIFEEDSSDQYLINWQSHRGYNRDVIKGDIQYTVDVRYPRRYNGDCQLINPESERICDLTYKGSAINDDAQFIIATNQYRAYSGKFPGSGEDKVIALSTLEIPEIIELYIQNLIETEGSIKIYPEKNWQLYFGKENNLIYETSPTQQDYMYIVEKNSKVKFTGKYDDQKFALYSIRS